jgi:hypothetical protein
MQDAAMSITPIADEWTRENHSQLPCNMSLGQVDYFNLYLEQRVADHVQRCERDSQR